MVLGRHHCSHKTSSWKEAKEYCKKNGFYMLMEPTSECNIDLRGGGEWIGVRRQWIITSVNRKTGMKYRYTGMN